MRWNNSSRTALKHSKMKPTKCVWTGIKRKWSKNGFCRQNTPLFIYLFLRVRVHIGSSIALLLLFSFLLLVFFFSLFIAIISAQWLRAQHRQCISCIDPRSPVCMYVRTHSTNYYKLFVPNAYCLPTHDSLPSDLINFRIVYRRHLCTWHTMKTTTNKIKKRNDRRC